MEPGVIYVSFIKCECESAAFRVGEVVSTRGVEDDHVNHVHITCVACEAVFCMARAGDMLAIEVAEALSECCADVSDLGNTEKDGAFRRLDVALEAWRATGKRIVEEEV